MTTDIPIRKHTGCEHPRLSNTCEVCRYTNLAISDRDAAMTIQRLINKISKEQDKKGEFVEIVAALKDGRRALRDDAKVWENIAQEIVKKYGRDS